MSRSPFVGTKLLPRILPFPEAPQGRPQGSEPSPPGVPGVQTLLLGIFVHHQTRVFIKLNSRFTDNATTCSMNHNFCYFMSDLECLTGKHIFHQKISPDQSTVACPALR